MPNFFQTPMIPRVTNPEPPGFNLIRQMLMQQMFRKNANLFGMNPGGSMGGNPMIPSSGRGVFNPYTGMMQDGGYGPRANPAAGGDGNMVGGPGFYGGRWLGPNPAGGSYDPNGGWRAGANPGMGGGGFKGRIPNGGGSTGNSFYDMFQNLMQHMAGGQSGPGMGAGGRGPVPFRSDVPGGANGVGIGTRPPSPGTGGIAPGAGGTNVNDAGQGTFAEPPMMDTAPRSGPPGPPTAEPPLADTGPRMRPFFDGSPEYDGRPDIAKAVHNHMAMMKSVLPMLMQPSRMATTTPTPTSGGPMPGYDGAMLTRPGGGYAPYDGMAPENAPSWTPLSERSGGTGLNLAQSNVPNSLPMARDVPPLPRPGYDGEACHDGNDDAAYGGSRVRAPMVMPRPSMGVRPPMNAAAGLQRILAGQMGANRRGQIGVSRLGSHNAAFDGSMEQPRGPAPSYDAGTSTIPASTPQPGDPGYMDPGGSASPYPSGAQTGGQAMYPWLMPYTGHRTAGMSRFENQGLGSMSDFVGGGMNLGQSQNYLNDLMSGKYVGSDNSYMKQFQTGAQTLKDQEDALARQRIGSSMAAGGNALSGARMASEQQYQNTSDASFQKMLAEMLMQNLARERALQQGGVGLQAGLSNEYMGGLGQLMGAGAVPRNIQQSDFNSQYQDWLRQIGAMNDSDKFQQNLAIQMLHTSPGAYQPGYGTSAAEGIAALLAGSGGGSALGNLLKGLLGGGSGGGSKGGGGGGGGPTGGGGGNHPGTDANGNAPDDPNYDYASDPANWGDMGQGEYGPFMPPGDMGMGDYGPYPWDDPTYGGGGGYDIFGGGLPGEDPWIGTGGSGDMGGEYGDSYGGD